MSNETLMPVTVFGGIPIYVSEHLPENKIICSRDVFKRIVKEGANDTRHWLTVVDEMIEEQYAIADATELPAARAQHKVIAGALKDLKTRCGVE